jgi:hypothetical protein
VVAYGFQPGLHRPAKRVKVAGSSRSEQIKEMFRASRGMTDLDEDTIEFVCQKIDTFALNSTFNTYYSSFKLFLEWCLAEEIVPWNVTKEILCKFVRHRL